MEQIEFKYGIVPLCFALLASVACGDDEPPPPEVCLNEAASPILIGAAEAIVTTTGASSVVAPSADGIKLAKYDANKLCGLFHTATGGTPIEFLENDTQDDLTLAPVKVQELIDAGVVAILGVGGAPTTTATAAAIIGANLMLGSFSAPGDELSGCTSAQLANPAITKSTTPTYGDPTKCFDHRGLFYRAPPTAEQIGEGAGLYVHENLPTITAAAAMFGPEAVMKARRAGVLRAWASYGNTIVSDQTHLNNNQNPTNAEFKTMLDNMVPGNPKLIFMALRPGSVRTFMQAYVEKRDDPAFTTKPSNFDSMIFVNAFPIAPDNYSNVSATALTAMVNQFHCLQTTYPIASEASDRFAALYEEFQPGGVTSTPTARGYDVAMVMLLAMEKAQSTVSTDAALELMSVTNPPGEIIYPGELDKARDFISRGIDVNYEGASGAMDLDEQGNTHKVEMGLVRVQANGVPDFVPGVSIISL